MEASRAFQQGKPFLDDAAYDDLKLQLRRDRSSVVAQVRFPRELMKYRGQLQPRTWSACITCVHG